MLLIYVMLGISAFALITHFVLSSYGKNKEAGFDLKEKLEKVIEDNKLDITLTIKEKAKPCYDYIEKEAIVRKGNTLAHVAEGFHELGHAIDAKDYDGSKMGAWGDILFYLLKYSIPLAIFSYILQESVPEWTWMVIPTSIFVLTSIWFFFGTLNEEIKATRNALIEIKKQLELSKEELKVVKITLMNGMMSYLVLCVMCLTLLVFQIIYAVQVYM